ncbi:MAG TPA: GntR family transcriptional regulator [Acidimicrobiales bacterium]|nr:GntR family transcriptional regulator [Acidimicrobiales bacterium]
MRPTSPTRISRIEKVRQGLVHDLATGKLRVGTKLINEEGLATRFHVSRSSVREAVSALVTAGYLERHHGSGTYVVGVPGPRHALDATLSYTRMIAEAGMRPGLRVLSVERRPAEADEGTALNLSPGEPIRRLERIRTADGRPVIYSIDIVPERYVSAVPNKTFNRSLYDVLSSIGEPVVNANAVLTPITAGRALARLLDVKIGSALQQIIEVDYTKSGRPIVFSSEWHVPGIFELRVHRRA